MPRDLLEGIGRYLKRVAPDRADELLAQIRSRAEELSDADDDIAVDRPAKGLLTMASVVLASFEVLPPMFDGDERRTIRYLQRGLSAPCCSDRFDVGVEALVKHDPSLDSIDSLCRKDFAMYGFYFGIEFGRPDPDAFEMRVDRCFFRDFLVRHDARPITTVLCGWDANWMQALDPRTGRTGGRCRVPFVLVLMVAVGNALPRAARIMPSIQRVGETLVAGEDP